MDDPDLIGILAAHGVCDLTVDAFSFRDAQNEWIFDTHLLDVWQLEVAVDDARSHDIVEMMRRSPDVER